MPKTYGLSLYHKLKPETQELVDEYNNLNINGNDQDWRWMHKYPASALTGDIPAGKPIIQAAYRHFKDVERDDVYICPKAITSIMTWFKFIPIPDGAMAGKPMTLSPPLIWMTCSIIGWRWSYDEFEVIEGEQVKIKAAGKRRFKESFNLVARKFTKTTWAAAMMLYCLYKGDYRPRAYSFATTLSQASETWKAAASMIDLSPQLAKHFDHNKITSNRPIITIDKKNGSFIPMASNSDKQDGLNPIAATLDECHAILDYNVYGVVTSAFGAQEEYTFIIVTTAGTVLDGLCTTLHKTGLKVLNPDDDYELDTIFYSIFQIDEEDDWGDERAWLKANPSAVYGRPSIAYLRGEYKKAQNSYEQRANFLTKHCNTFVNSASKWLDISEVRQCSNPALNYDNYKHKKCILALDRAVTHDITSLCIMFPDDDGGVTAFWRNIQTENAINNSNDHLQGIYRKAEHNGHLEVITDSNAIRTEHITRMVSLVYEELPLCDGLAYDPYKMTEAANRLDEAGIPTIAVGQGAGNMSEPSKKLEELISNRELRYNGDTLFDFSCQCAVMGVTKFNNVAVYKEDYKTEKIDPLIALIIGLSVVTLNKIEEKYNPLLDPDFNIDDLLI